MTASQDYRDGASWAALEVADRVRRANELLGAIDAYTVELIAKIVASDMGGHPPVDEPVEEVQVPPTGGGSATERNPEQTYLDREDRGVYLMGQAGFAPLDRYFTSSFHPTLPPPTSSFS